MYQLLETVNRDQIFPGSCRVLLSDFDYELPPGLIAQEPIPAREQARLLRFDRHSGAPTHHRVEHLPALLKPGDLLVINNTRVFPARLFGHRTPSGGSVECLLLARLDERRWDTLMHPGQKLKEGARVVFEEEGYRLYLEVLERRFYGRRTVSLTTDAKMDVNTVINAIGHVPLPPYIKRSDQPRYRERYQTTYGRVRGSVAAPTAGLHLTSSLLAGLSDYGIQFVEITLHVGYGTFQPIRTVEIAKHRVGAEWFDISPDSAARIETAIRRGDGRIVAGSGVTDLYNLSRVRFSGCRRPDH